jgi:hypothetical protein
MAHADIVVESTGMPEPMAPPESNDQEFQAFLDSIETKVPEPDLTQPRRGPGRPRRS